MTPRSLFLVPLIGQACAPSAPHVAQDPRPTPVVRCSEQALAAFEPEGEVVARGPLPPMEQATEAHTEQLIVVVCQEEEDEETCLDRARQSSASAYPTGAVTEAAIGVDREIVRATVRHGDREEVITAESLVALAGIITERRQNGEPLVVVQAERIGAPDAQRSAVLRVALPGRLQAREALRAYLVLSAPTNPVRALLDLQVRAAEAQIAVRVVEPQPDGTIRVEIGCERWGEPAQSAPGTEGQGEGGTAPGS